MIDRQDHRPLYVQLADILREQIRTGQLLPGAVLPSELSLQQGHDLGRPAVRQAIEVLEREGLVVKERGRPTRVREEAEREPIVLGPNDEAITRMPSDPERRRLGLPLGEPVLEVRRGDGGVDVYRGSTAVVRSR
jgi:DNA-binding GntR family transcriptional regulator